jgi:hypothetical protein
MLDFLKHISRIPTNQLAVIRSILGLPRGDLVQRSKVARVNGSGTVQNNIAAVSANRRRLVGISNNGTVYISPSNTIGSFGRHGDGKIKEPQSKKHFINRRRMCN